MLERIFDRTSIAFLKKGLDGSALAQKATASNIANATTPGYRRRQVRFQEDLRRALHRRNATGFTTHLGHISIRGNRVDRIVPELYVPSDNSRPSGINNVDIDKEMAELAKNQLFYNMATRLLSDKFNRLKSCISGKSYR